jgi:hypothetical protein
VDVIPSPAISSASVQKSQNYLCTLTFNEVYDHGAVSLRNKDKGVTEMILELYLGLLLGLFLFFRSRLWLRFEYQFLGISEVSLRF